MADSERGPLAGRTVIELAGIGPGPYAGMVVADRGADDLRVDRPGATAALALGDGARRGGRPGIAAVLDLPVFDGAVRAAEVGRDSACDDPW
ncbi:hypothetical protein [Pseudonocardia sp. WMMC193]|uniref:hypothetical protein n=1 Tax=Pseudonocardia sp. WMMC193 TaxID=2911965 RepID=UPI001F1C6824|nr:hypothetical protein [Pseudonocardia sp. WMMC193]MCF7548592.1 hypothetical protein [Pseudonocardia sp. WMMC193]